MGTKSVDCRNSLVHGQAGFSLVEVLVAAGMATVIALGMATMLSQQGKQIKDLRHVSTRDDKRNQLDTDLKTPWTVLESAGGAVYSTTTGYIGLTGMQSGKPYPVPKNEVTSRLSANNGMLYDCIWGTGPCVSKNASGKIWYDIYLLPRSASFIDKKYAIAGPTGSPIYFNTNGEACSPPGGSCSIQVEAQFNPICEDPNDQTCPSGKAAKSINVKYKISPYTGPGASPASPMYLHTIYGDVAHEVKKILDDATFVPGGAADPCTSPGQFTTLDSAGNKVCRDTLPYCADPNVITVTSSGAAVCDVPLRKNPNTGGNDQSSHGVCNAGFVAIGVANNGEVKCRQVIDTAVASPPAPVDSTYPGTYTTPNNVACPTGQYMVGLQAMGNNAVKPICRPVVRQKPRLNCTHAIKTVPARKGADLVSGHTSTASIDCGADKVLLGWEWAAAEDGDGTATTQCYWDFPMTGSMVVYQTGPFSGSAQTANISLRNNSLGTGQHDACVKLTYTCCNIDLDQDADLYRY